LAPCHRWPANCKDRDNDDPAVVAEDYNASGNGALQVGLDLGLSLFGTSYSYRDHVEEEFDERLQRVAEELEEIRSGLVGLLGKEEGGSGATITTMAMASDDDDDEWKGPREATASKRVRKCFGNV
jgi:hypothetical protein